MRQLEQFREDTAEQIAIIHVNVTDHRHRETQWAMSPHIRMGFKGGNVMISNVSCKGMDSERKCRFKLQTQRVFAVKMNRDKSESVDIVKYHNDGIGQQTEQRDESRLRVEEGVTLGDEQRGCRQRDCEHQKGKLAQSVDGQGLVECKRLRHQFTPKNH